MRKQLRKLRDRLDEIEAGVRKGNAVDLLDKGLRFGLEVYRQFVEEVGLKEKVHALTVKATYDRSMIDGLSASLTVKAKETRQLADAVKAVIDAWTTTQTVPVSLMNALPEALKKVTKLGEPLVADPFVGAAMSFGPAASGEAKEWLKAMFVDPAKPPCDCGGCKKEG